MTRIAVMVLVALSLAGCGRNPRLTVANYEKIAPGMTVAEVEAILGPGEPEGGDLSLAEGSSVAGAIGIGGDLQSMARPRNQTVTYKWGNDRRWIKVTFQQGKVAQGNSKQAHGLN